MRRPCRRADLAYRDTVLPPGIRARVSVEAGVSSGWESLGGAGRSAGAGHYGAFADYQTLYRQSGITAAAVAATALDSIYDAQNITRPGGHPATFARPPAAPPTALPDPEGPNMTSDTAMTRLPSCPPRAWRYGWTTFPASCSPAASSSCSSPAWHVVGVTTNPTIFASALAKGDRYDGQLRHLAELGASTQTAIFTVTTDDVRAACDVLSPVYEQTAGKDGRVSI